MRYLKRAAVFFLIPALILCGCRTREHSHETNATEDTGSTPQDRSETVSGTSTESESEGNETEEAFPVLSTEAEPSVLPSGIGFSGIAFRETDSASARLAIPFSRTMYSSIEETTGGFYQANGVDYSHMYYFDWNTGQTAFLCTDPSCTHQYDENCDAFYGFITAGSMQVYDGHLYCWAMPEMDKILYRTDLDGRNRVDMGGIITPEGFRITVYYSGITQDTVFTMSPMGYNDNGFQLDSVWKRPLNESGKAEQIFLAEDNKWPEQQINDFYVGTDFVWFGVSKFRQNEETGVLEQQTDVYRYSITEGVLQKILTVDQLISFFEWEGDIYYSLFDQEVQEFEDGVYRLRADGTTETLIDDYGGTLTCDGTCIYINKVAKPGMYIYDMEGRLLSVLVPQTLPEGYNEGTTPNYIYFRYQGESERYEIYRKKDVFEGVLSPVCFERVKFQWKDE